MFPWQYACHCHRNIHGNGMFFVWIWIDLFTHEVDLDLDSDPDKWCSVNGAPTIGRSKIMGSYFVFLCCGNTSDLDSFCP